MPHKSSPVEVSKLLFDPENPRLPETTGRTQPEIFRFLVDQIGIEDLLQSIATAGIIEGDPIIVRPSEADTYFVIEGNRRLAALKLLKGDRIGDGQEEPSVPQISADLRQKLHTINVQQDWNSSELEAYLGYKHVTATKEWPPEAKARFVLNRCGGDLSQDRLSTFAKRLGTNTATLRRWINAELTLKQAEREGLFNPSDAYAKRYFGTFYTLLGSQEVQDFLDLNPTEPRVDPVPVERLPNLKEFIEWTIGTKKVPPVVNSRSQQQLNAVLSSPKALQHFRLRKELEQALLYTEFNANEISAKLLTAAFTIEECLPKLFDVKSEPNVSSALKTLDGAYAKLKINTSDNPAPNK